MNIRDAGEESSTVKNNPSDLVERRDGDGMGLVLAQPGSGELTGFAVKPVTDEENGLRVFSGLHRTLVGLGHDEKNSAVSAIPTRWTSSQISVANTTDSIVAGKSRGTATITAANGVARGQAEIEVLGELDSLATESTVINLEAEGSSAVISLTGQDIEGFAAPVEPQDIEVDNPNSETFKVEPTDDGKYRVTAIGETGSAVLTFSHGEVSTQVSVAVPLEVKVIDDFSDISGWTTAHDRAPTGSIEAGEGHDGYNSIKLNYDFTESTATRGRYAVAPGAPTPGDGSTGGITIPGQPQKLSVWVKGDGKGSLLRLQVMQANGVRNWIDGPGGSQSLLTTWSGWERQDFIVPADFTFPLKLERIRILETVGSKQYSGSLEFSQILAYLPPEGTESPVNERVEDPIITAADATDQAPLRVAVMSDAQFVGREPDSAQVRGARSALQEIVAEDPDMLIINGDFVDESNDIDFELAKSILDTELNGVDFPWYYLPGNHEVMGQPISNFKKFFGENKQSFTVEHTRFVMLDSSSLRLATDFSQITQIRAELDAAADDPKITGVMLVTHVPTNDPLPSKASEISNRQEAEMLDDWAQEFRAESGKSIAFINGHVGVFNTSRIDGVPYVINGNSGKDPASTPANGGFTGWTMLGVDPSNGNWEDVDAADSGAAWLGVEVKPRVEALRVTTPQETLTAGERFALAPEVEQSDTGSSGTTETRDVPVAWPISYTWSGSSNVYVGDADDAPEAAIAALDPATSTLTALRSGSGEATLLVNGETRTVEFAVAGGSVQLTGDPVFGNTLQAEVGTWAAGATVHFQWLRDGIKIPDANAANYQLRSADLNTAISVSATISVDGRADIIATAAATGQVALASLEAPEVRLAGNAVVGSVLTANTGSWPTGTGLVFQWLRNGTEITGAVSSGYEITEADLDAQLSVRVTGILEGHSEASATSSASAPVKLEGDETGGEIPATVVQGTVSITGTAAVGKTLTIRSSAWKNGVSFARQWYRNGVAIPGANGAKYMLTSKDLHSRISATVVAATPGLISVQAQTNVTTTVKLGKLSSIARPSIKGTVKVGNTLKLKLGKVPSGAKVKATWFVGKKAVKTGTSYKVKSGDRNKRISVKITVTKPGYASQTKTSASKTARAR